MFFDIDYIELFELIFTVLSGHNSFYICTSIILVRNRLAAILTGLINQRYEFQIFDERYLINSFFIDLLAHSPWKIFTFVLFDFLTVMQTSGNGIDIDFFLNQKITKELIMDWCG